jgi:hypothetical protein
LFGYTSWPGRVIVIEHTIDGRKYYSQYGHLRYPKGGFPNDPNRGDPWAIPVFGTTGNDNLSFRHPNDPYIYVRRGQQIGRVMEWPGDPSNSHLHFEVRTRPTGAWQGNCQGFGYTSSNKSSDDPRSLEQWLEEVYYWLNPVNFIYEHARSGAVPLLTDSETPLEVRDEPSDEEGGIVGQLDTETVVRALELEKAGDGEWWYRLLGPRARGWIKAFKLSNQPPSYERKREILAGEIPPRARPTTAIRYSYSFNQLSGTANVPRGSNFTIWKAYGGCGFDAVDYALCQVGNDGRVRAYNHDCLSGEGLGTFGPWVRQGGCSRAEEFGWEVVCCAEPF